MAGLLSAWQSWLEVEAELGVQPAEETAALLMLQVDSPPPVIGWLTSCWAVIGREAGRLQGGAG